MNVDVWPQAVFMAIVSSMAAAGFTLYGGRLFIMLRRFPVQSPGRRKKLKEVRFRARHGH
eukprot:1195285-Prorocentrum_minimum.AAC.6